MNEYASLLPKRISFILHRQITYLHTEGYVLESLYSFCNFCSRILQVYLHVYTELGVWLSSDEDLIEIPSATK